MTSSTPDNIRATVASGFIHEALVGLAGEWWHFSWQYDGMHSTLLVNDMLVNNVEEHIATVIPSETHLYVGVSPAFADPRAGDVEALRISANGVALAHWTFDEGRGPISYDDIEGREIELYNVDWLEECD